MNEMQRTGDGRVGVETLTARLAVDLRSLADLLETVRVVADDAPDEQAAPATTDASWQPRHVQRVLVGFDGLARAVERLRVVRASAFPQWVTWATPEDLVTWAVTELATRMRAIEQMGDANAKAHEELVRLRKKAAALEEALARADADKERWQELRDGVTSALLPLHPGGVHYADVPRLVRELVEAVELGRAAAAAFGKVGS